MMQFQNMNSKTVRAASEIFAALVFSILWSSLALALDIPKLHGRVTDLASMLRPSTVQQLETNLAALEQSDSTQIAVLTIPSLEGDSLEDFSLHVVEKWRLGQKNLDNGALLLISKGDRKIRIEVGYGLEGVLTDLVSGRIIRDIITPQFRNGNFDQGVIDGIAAMSSAVKGEFKASEQLSAHSGEGDFNGFLGAFLFFLFVVGRIFRKRKLAAGIGGALVAPLLSYVFMGFDPARLLFFSFFGFVAGIIASAILTGAGATGVRGIRRSSRGSFGGGFGGGFGGSSGGFSGGGGGFGGGGASGGW